MVTGMDASGFVKENTIRFLTEAEGENLRLQQMGLPFSKEEALVLLREIYE